MDEPAEERRVDDLDAALDDMLRHCRDLGLVELWEAGMAEWEYFDALQRLRSRGPLPVRVRLLVASGLAEQGMRPRTGDDSLDLAGVKFYADGWLGHRTCSMSHGFLDRPDEHGVLFQDATKLARRMAPFAERGWLIATHAIGDHAIEMVLDAYEAVFGEDDVRAAAPRIEHAQVLRPDLIDRMAAMGVVACIQPSFARSDVEHVEAALGDHWPEAYHWRSLLDAGVRVVAGSDYPIEDIAPLQGLKDLVAGPFDPIPVETALSLMTDDAAGHTTFSIDPRTIPAEQLGTVTVVDAQPRGALEA